MVSRPPYEEEEYLDLGLGFGVAFPFEVMLSFCPVCASCFLFKDIRVHGRGAYRGVATFVVGLPRIISIVKSKGTRIGMVIGMHEEVLGHTSTGGS